MYFMVNLLVFTTSVLVVVLIYEFVINRKRLVTERLTDIRSMEENIDEENVLYLPFLERIIWPVFRSMGEYLGNLAPREIRNNLEQRIIHAGNPWGMTFNNLVLLQLITGALFLILTLIILNLVDIVLPQKFLLVFLITLIGLYIPVAVINSKASHRQGKIQKSLPDMLDLLLVSVEAGLGFDMALKRVTEKMPGELSKELSRALEEIRRGRTREDALRGIVTRTGVPDVSSFITSVIQAEQLGSNIANTLRVQADSMRQKRKQRAEEKAMKAPIKMLFPLIFFIFPTLFVVLLGPAVIRIVQMFSTTF